MIETTEKKGKARKAQRDRALQKRINIRKARLQAHDLTQNNVARKFNCSFSFVCKSIAEERNSKKAANIREFIDGLRLPDDFYISCIK